MFALAAVARNVQNNWVKMYNIPRTKRWKVGQDMGLINDMVGYQLTDIHKMHYFHGSMKIIFLKAVSLFFFFNWL